MNRAEWAECAMILATFYPHNFKLGADAGNDEASAMIAQGQMALWFHALADLPGPRVKAAVWSMVRTQPAFPSVADIRRLAEGNADPAADAWDAAMRHAMDNGGAPEHRIWNPDPSAPALPPLDAIAEKCVRAVGGLRELAYGPSDRLPTLRAQFLKLYQGFAQEAKRQATFDALGVESAPLPLASGPAAGAPAALPPAPPPKFGKPKTGPQALNELFPAFNTPTVEKEQPHVEHP